MALTINEIALELVKLVTPTPQQISPQDQEKTIELYLMYLKRIQQFERENL